MTDRDAMKLALEALENHEGNYKLTDAGCDRHEKTIAALREALAKQTGDIGIGTPSSQPAQQEPVPCCGKYETCTQACTPRGRFLGKREALAEQPAQRTWVGLTKRDVELLDGMIEVQLNHAAQCDRMANRVMADKQKGWNMERVELLRKLKEKNENRN